MINVNDNIMDMSIFMSITHGYYFPKILKWDNFHLNALSSASLYNEFGRFRLQKYKIHLNQQRIFVFFKRKV